MKESRDVDYKPVIRDDMLKICKEESMIEEKKQWWQLRRWWRDDKKRKERRETEDEKKWKDEKKTTDWTQDNQLFDEDDPPRDQNSVRLCSIQRELEVRTRGEIMIVWWTSPRNLTEYVMMMQMMSYDQVQYSD